MDDNLTPPLEPNPKVPLELGTNVTTDLETKGTTNYTVDSLPDGNRAHPPNELGRGQKPRRVVAVQAVVA